MKRRSNLVFLSLFVFVFCDPMPAADSKPVEKPAENPRVFTGKVQMLGTILAKQGVKLDADAAAAVGLVADDGTVFVLAKDDASRLLFLDKLLLDKPVKLTGHVVKGTQILKVEKVQTVVKGLAHNVDYWCEACQFANPQPGPCRCCGGETVFREVLAK